MQTIIVNIIFIFSLIFLKILYQKFSIKTFFNDVYTWRKYILFWMPSILMTSNFFLGLAIYYYYFIFSISYFIFLVAAILWFFLIQKIEERNYSNARKSVFSCLTKLLEKNLITDENVKVYLRRKSGLKRKWTLTINTKFFITVENKKKLIQCINKKLNNKYKIEFKSNFRKKK